MRLYADIINSRSSRRSGARFGWHPYQARFQATVRDRRVPQSQSDCGCNAFVAEKAVTACGAPRKRSGKTKIADFVRGQDVQRLGRCSVHRFDGFLSNQNGWHSNRTLTNSLLFNPLTAQKATFGAHVHLTKARPLRPHHGLRNRTSSFQCAA
jgi:hypothetical protein